jgi:3-deoxy-manno-octulosonate cytidylyltransferase (CMP-KDO synthetase)
MIEHVYRRAAAASTVDAVVVATDDVRIATAVRKFGGCTQLTSLDHRTGTDRIAEVANTLTCDVVVNVQGDEPLLEPTDIDLTVRALEQSQAALVTTLRCPITNPSDLKNPHVVKVVVDHRGRALHFYRTATTLSQSTVNGQQAGVFKHVGIYAYRRTFLLIFAALSRTPLEISESLEQLRALEHGHDIETIETQHDSVGVDTPAGLELVRQRLATKVLP